MLFLILIFNKIKKLKKMKINQNQKFNYIYELMTRRRNYWYIKYRETPLPAGGEFRK